MHGPVLNSFAEAALQDGRHQGRLLPRAPPQGALEENPKAPRRVVQISTFPPPRSAMASTPILLIDQRSIL